MAELRVHNYALSVDGYAAGPDQSREDPLGRGAEQLHVWMFRDEMPAVDAQHLRSGDEGVGATVMGRNMFGPIRGAWDPAEEWRGWWGPEPPYRHPVFVLTHHPHEPIEMAGGTTFHFVTDGIESALDEAFAAAGGQDVRLGGGAATVRQYLQARLVDRLHLAISPVLLGGGERLFDDLDALALGYECVGMIPGGGVTHVHLERSR